MDISLLEPGDAVSFTATEVDDYFGALQVTAISDFTITSTGNDVHVVDGQSGVTYATNGPSVVDAYGETVSAPGGCGAGKECFDMDVNGTIYLLRVAAGTVYQNDCIHWIGPLSEFSGVSQFDAQNFDWYRYY